MASSWIPPRIYHVFLSFRGPDVRNNFINSLYRALDWKGIYTFIDSEELRKGEQIWPELEKAIEESYIAIVVFSENYAFSSCCLDEVAKIMECKEKRDLKVFPVFYKVEPKEVKTPREKYREAMVKHELKFGENSEKVKQWKEALFKAGNLFGWHLTDGDDLEHTQKIVKEIATLLGLKPLQVAKHLVAIDSRKIEVKSMLNLESNDGVLMMGFWGKGGIGKTTLAKVIYNDIFTQFDGSCFLANVREASKDCKDLVTLQKELLFKILLHRKEFEASYVHEGTTLIRERLRRRKVLLILDDVDDLRQLNALAGEGNWFGKGSRIIFTTRDKHLLTAHGIDHVYEVKELYHEEAHKLLSKHAFPLRQKSEIKTHLVDDVLNYAKGLPLALEVLGSLLCGRTEHEWKSTLNKLSKIPNGSVNGVLKISYDRLEYNEKEIFLHIACFFKGQQIEYIKKVLDSCDFDTEIGLKILIERCLITIEIMDLQMHDLIHLMGTDIVKQECRDDPGRRSRVWLYDDFLDVRPYDMEDCEIKAIVLKPPKLKELSICPNAFTRMRRLRLLILHNVHYVHNSFQDPVCLPNWLRWWEWPGAPWTTECSPGPKKLVGLDMSKSMITIAPKQFKDFQNLMYINFSHCNSMVHMPDFSCTPNLKELNFACCKNLVEAHESIAYLDKLEVLNLFSCSELSVFPNVLNSENLRHFEFSGTKFERFPDIPHILKGFEYLSFSNTAIKELPTSIENLVALKRMSIIYCKNLKCLPSSIYKLQNLEDLSIQDCPNLIGFPKYEDSADPCMKAGLSNLRSLTLEGCNMSEVEFLENPSCLPLLNTLIIMENNITTLPTSINKRDSLSTLDISNCHQLQEIPELPPFLTHFLAENCESLQKNEDLIPIHHIVRVGSTISEKSFEDCPKFLLPQGEMPQWVFPIEEDSISFMVSKDLYDKIIGVAYCTVIKNDEKVGIDIFSIDSYVDGKHLGGDDLRYDLLDLDHVAIGYLPEFWGEVDFAQIAGCCRQFGVKVQGEVVKKWGLRIICKQLGGDLKAELRDNQFIDPALLYEVGHGSTNLAAESSHMHEDNLREANLQEDLQDCQMSTGKHTQTVSRLEAKCSHMHGDSLMEIDQLKNFQDCQMRIEEHSQRGLKRKHELTLPQGWLHL